MPTPNVIIIIAGLLSRWHRAPDQQAEQDQWGCRRLPNTALPKAGLEITPSSMSLHGAASVRPEAAPGAEWLEVGV
jgi:hypothetical protein